MTAHNRNKHRLPLIVEKLQVNIKYDDILKKKKKK